METIRNYLEMMFSNLPNTPEVKKAHDELLQMMEDKFDALRLEGKPENEAVAAVISEFGNLDELAESLGIGELLKRHKEESTAEQNIPRRTVILSEARSFLSDTAIASAFRGIATAFCILSPAPLIALSMTANGPMLGLIALFACIAVGVALFIIAGSKKERWEYLRKEPCMLDYTAAQYVGEQHDAWRTKKALLTAFGTILCVLSPLAVIIGGFLEDRWVGTATLGVSCLLLMVAIGVFMFILANGNEDAMRLLLSLNDMNTMAGSYSDQQQRKKHYINEGAALLMSIWWPMITCIYLSVSFLTFRWEITWIIWPVAAVLRPVLDIALSKEMV